VLVFPGFVGQGQKLWGKGGAHRSTKDLFVVYMVKGEESRVEYKSNSTQKFFDGNGRIRCNNFPSSLDVLIH